MLQIFSWQLLKIMLPVSQLVTSLEDFHASYETFKSTNFILLKTIFFYYGWLIHENLESFSNRQT